MLDALAAMAQIWSRDYGTVETHSGEVVEVATLSELLGDHNGWTGWEGVYGDGKNRAILIAAPFDC